MARGFRSAAFTSLDETAWRFSLSAQKEYGEGRWLGAAVLTIDRLALMLFFSSSRFCFPLPVSLFLPPCSVFRALSRWVPGREWVRQTGNK